jgi:hypothetical protein
MSTCSICCENINNTTRKLVTCPYCNIETCMTCFKRYLCELVSPTPECMGCNKQLSLDFVANTTPKIFHNQEYRKVRANILLSHERSLLPTSQYLVEEHRAKIIRDRTVSELTDELKYLKSRIREIKHEIRHVQKEDRVVVPCEKKKFMMHCPIGECRGFLSQAWKCGTCESYICSKCRCVKNDRDDDEHVCNPDDVATVSLLKNETKPCPTCAVPIFKISGCPQMWCTECHTTFCWNTGKIETGTVHNPHFFQWQRDNNGGVAPRVPGDNPCGQLPSFIQIRNVLNIRGIICDDFSWVNCYRLVGHIRDVTMQYYPLQIDQDDNSDLRLKFLLNEISEETWLRHLTIRQKRSEKNHDVNQILEFIVVSIIDIFNRFIIDSIDMILELNNLKQYANRELQKVAIRYGNKVPFINTTWTISHSS